MDKNDWLRKRLYPEIHEKARGRKKLAFFEFLVVNKVNLPVMKGRKRVPEKEYLIRLSEKARKRHYHKTEKGKLVKFMAQLEVEANKGIWKPVVRYDCSHNFSHRDIYKIDGDKKRKKYI